MATSSSAQQVMRSRPYKDFLTPSYHRRFTNAAAVALVACWVEAILMSRPSLFWSWFPFGLTGIRTLLLFLSCLMVFIQRITNLHTGQRNTASPIITFWQFALTRQTLQTVLWYTLSAFLYSEVYIFATTADSNLGWVDPGRSYERPRLNERPILFRSLFMCLAIAQTGMHVYYDYDALPLCEQSQQASAHPDPGAVGAPQKLPSLKRLQTIANPALQRAAILTIIVTCTGPAAYFLFLRRTAWAITHAIGKTLFTLHKSTKPSGLTDVIPLGARFAISAFQLVLLWEVSNQAFTMFAREQPLKKGQPLTIDSRDPNGSLIAGLKMKKDLPRSMALWELALITNQFDARRQTIYQEIDRQGGSTWSQVSAQCLAEMQAVSKAASDILNPPRPPPPQTAQQAPSLPKLSQPLRQENILNASPRPSSTMDALAQGVGSVAKSLGQPQGSTPVAPRAQKLIQYGSDKVLSKEQQQQLSMSNVSKQANDYLVRFLKTPIGVVFRQPFWRRLNALVLGLPYSRVNNVQHAIQALSKLTTSSLREDRFGQVQKDVPTIIRVFVSTIQSLQSLRQGLSPHWTDVEFDKKREDKEIDELLTALRDGLEQILISFGEYADALGLSQAELRMAKETINKRPEMEVAKQ